MGYFEAARQHRKLPHKRVRVRHPDATDPLSLVEAALDERALARRDLGRHPADQTWVSFDGDEHRAGATERQRWNDAIRIANREKLHLAISNPCFELWYLLHFRDQHAAIHRDAARRALISFVPEYEKSDVLFKQLSPKLAEAHTRAVDLCQRREQALQDGSLRDPHANPITRVHLLVEHLLSLPT